MPHWQRLHAVFRNHHLGKRLPSPDGRRHGGNCSTTSRRASSSATTAGSGRGQPSPKMPSSRQIRLSACNRSSPNPSGRNSPLWREPRPRSSKTGSNGAVKEKWAKDAQHVPPQLHGLNRLRMPGHVPQGAPRHADRRCPALPSSMLFPRSALLPETHFRLPIWG